MTEDEGGSPAVRAGAISRGRKPRGGRPGSVRYSAELAQRICERVAGGELLYVVLRDAGMPTSQSVRQWALKRPDFGAALASARAVSGRESGGGVWTYCRGVAQEVFARMAEGESLTRIGADPTMPCLSTLFHWRRRIPEFEAGIEAARGVMAERFCDMGWDLAMEATPETAYLTHVRLTQLRWTAGALAPRVYKLKNQEPAQAQPQLTLAIRRFEIEVDPQTGEKKVVAYTPNPETGLAEREDAPDWRPPAGVVRLPGGG